MNRADHSQLHYRNLALVRLPLWIIDVRSLRFVWANPPGLALWNSPSLAEFKRRDLSRDITPTVRERLLQHHDDLAGTNDSVAEHWTLYPHGTPQSYECVITDLPGAEDEGCLLIQAMKKDEVSSPDTLYRANALLHTSVYVSVYDEDGEMVYANPAARRRLGSSRRRLARHFCNVSDWQSLQTELELKGRVTAEARVHTLEGDAWHSLTLESCPDPVSGSNTILVSELDVTERREAQQRVHELAYVDMLTGLRSRTFLVEALTRRIEIARFHDDRFAIFFIDLDRFKLINDSLGHATGDKLLRAVAQRLQSSLSDEHLVARLGGDEFNVLMGGFERNEEVIQLAQQILSDMSQPVAVEKYELQVSPSIGVSIFPDHGKDVSALMQHADLAMYAAKRAGGGYQIFNDAMTTNVRERLRIENDLRLAAQQDQFIVHYQPKIDSRSGKVTGMEALIRWEHPTRGLVYPGDFIGIAEQNGMITEVTRLVLRVALCQQVAWQEAGFPLNMAINLSPRELRSPDIVDMIRHELQASGCDPSQIEFEITESMLMDDNLAVHQTLADIKSLGARLSIDDFGTGYSNLAYLQKFPLDSLKIDRSFLADTERQALLEMIIGVGRMLSLSVVAEGVETVDQLNWLLEHDCDQMQGFLFSRPMPADQATRYLQTYVSWFQTWPMGA